MALSPFAKLESLLGTDVMLLDATITEAFQSSQPVIPEISRYLISAGGKRVRPNLALGIGRMFDSQNSQRFYQAASLELLHTATLLHDDVVDRSDQRRGKSSSHLIWGNKSTILVGDFLFAKAFSMMVKLQNPAVLSILADTATAIAEGEMMQLVRAHDLDMTDADYIAMISGKTSILFKAATQTAALLAGQSEHAAWQCGQYGLNLGIAFQLADDALDYDANQAVLGKNIGDDFKEGKISAPALYAYRLGTNSEKSFWRRAFTAEQEPDDFAHAIALIQKYDVITQINQRACDYAERANACLDEFPVSAIKTTLQECALYAATREF